VSARVGTVELRRLPVAVHERAVEHGRMMRRELAVVRVADDRAQGAAELRALAAEMRMPWARFASGTDPVLQQALSRGTPEVDVHYEVPTFVATVAAHLDELLDLVEEHCRAGELVSLVSPPDVLAYRRWYLREFVAQLRDGDVPHAFGPTPRSSEPEPAVGSPAARLVVDGELDLRGAAALRARVADELAAGVTHLVVDLGRCPFVDSVGISLLLTTRARVAAMGGTFGLVGVSERVRSTLAVTGVLDLFAS
jgi:anti-sigma B factor antagonist